MEIESREDIELTRSMERIVLNLYHYKKEWDKNVILLTGASRSCGTSMISINMAVKLAESGWRTLVVDADFRDVVRNSQSPQEKGLSELIEDDGDFEDYVRETKYENLFVIEAGKLKKTPLKVLGSENIQDFIRSIKKSFDFVIIDTASINESPDACFLFPYVDGIILVVGLGVTTKRQNYRAKRMLEKIDRKYYGIIANDLPTKRKENKRKKENHKFEEETWRKKIGVKVSDIFKKLKEWLRLDIFVLCFFLSGIWILIFGVKVEAEDQSPMVILSDYELEDDEIVGGQVNQLEMTLENISETSEVYNVKLTLNFSTDQIYPEYGEDNQVYIDELLSGERQRVTIDLDSKEDIDVNHLNAYISLSYEDEYENTSENDISLVLPVHEKKISLKSAYVPQTSVLNQETYMNIVCANDSQETMYNVKLYVEGSSMEDLVYDIGTLQALGERSQDIYVVFGSEGEQSLQFSFSYEDGMGEEVKEKLDPYSIDVESKAIQEDSTTRQEKEANTFNGGLKKIIDGIGILTCGVITFIYLKRYLKQG